MPKYYIKADIANTANTNEFRIMMKTFDFVDLLTTVVASLIAHFLTQRKYTKLPHKTAKTAIMNIGDTPIWHCLLH